MSRRLWTVGAPIAALVILAGIAAIFLTGGPDQQTAITIYEVGGAAALAKAPEVSVPQGDTLRVIVANSTGRAREVSFRFSELPCTAPLQSRTVEPGSSRSVDCEVRGDLLKDGEDRRAIQYDVLVDNLAVDPRLIVTR